MRCANASTTVVLLFEQKFLSLGQMKHRNETRQKGTRGLSLSLVWLCENPFPRAHMNKQGEVCITQISPSPNKV